jgi:hypothetical protein
LAFAFIPRRRSLLQLVALGAGLSAAMQLTMNYWFSDYILWFAPLALATSFAVYETRPRATFALGRYQLADGAPPAAPGSRPGEIVQI